MVRSLYKSADMEEDLSITLELMRRMWHMRGHFGVILYCTKGIRVQKVPRLSGDKGDKGARVLKVPRVPRSKAQKVYLGAGFSLELISDRACLLKKVHLVHYDFGNFMENLKLENSFENYVKR